VHRAAMAMAPHLQSSSFSRCFSFHLRLLFDPLVATVFGRPNLI
jgi:hypothetical protein